MLLLFSSLYESNGEFSSHSLGAIYIQAPPCPFTTISYAKLRPKTRSLSGRFGGEKVLEDFVLDVEYWNNHVGLPLSPLFPLVNFSTQENHIKAKHIRARKAFAAHVFIQLTFGLLDHLFQGIFS
jgi:hypothetical protein